MVKKKAENRFWKVLGQVLLFIVKIPYFIVRGIYRLAVRIDKKEEESRVKKKRGAHT